MIIYLTGCPATGKTTLADALDDEFEKACVFKFGKELTNLLQRSDPSVTQEKLRTSTAHISKPDLVNEINEKVILFCDENRHKKHVIIDTHAVTTEANGFRITPMSLEQIHRLNPDIFVCLTAHPVLRQNRIASAALGRPQLSEEELRVQANIQASLVVGYSAATGKPAHFLKNETNTDLSNIKKELIRIISRT